MKAFRLNRLFHADSRRCLALAIGPGSLEGIDNLNEAIAAAAHAGADALELTIGQAELLQRIPGRQKPALILRADVANVPSHETPRAIFSRMIGNAAEQAVRLDAACLVANLFDIPGHPEVTDQCLENIAALQTDGERWCLPLMIEPLALCQNEESGGYVIDRDPEPLVALVQRAIELGADLLKVDPGDDASLAHQLVEIAESIPLLVCGESGASDAVILDDTERLIQTGAAGIIDGRNIIQHRDPAGMIRALLAIVHGGVSAKDAAKLIH